MIKLPGKRKKMLYLLKCRSVKMFIISVHLWIYVWSKWLENHHILSGQINGRLGQTLSIDQPSYWVQSLIFAIIIII